MIERKKIIQKQRRRRGKNEKQQKPYVQNKCVVVSLRVGACVSVCMLAISHELERWPSLSGPLERSIWSR